MKKIGWIGYGNTGVPTTDNLRRCGHHLMSYVRNKHKLNVNFDSDKRFIFTDSISKLVEHSDYIFLMLPNDDTNEGVINKLAQIPLNHRLIIKMSTISPNPSLKTEHLLKQHSA